MYLKYGTYQHDDNEAGITIEKNVQYNDRGNAYMTNERWTIDGVLQETSQSALMASILALEAGYAVNGKDLILYLDNGTASSHSLRNSNTLGGTRVTRLAYPLGTGGEAGIFRTYQIQVEGDLPVTSETLLSWSENLTFIGGGPRFVYLKTLNGLPQKQLVNQATPYQVIQEGSALGLFSYPTPNAPIWPGAEHIDQRQIVKRGPKRMSTRLTQYEISWRYIFESAVPLAGNPSAL